MSTYSTKDGRNCPECKGLGWIVQPEDDPADETCPTCGGDGLAHD